MALVCVGILAAFALFSCNIGLDGTDGYVDSDDSDTTDTTDGQDDTSTDGVDDSASPDSYLTIDAAAPTAESAISDGDSYSFDVTYCISEGDFDSSATYELQVFLSGDGKSSKIDCGSEELDVTASGEGSTTIDGELLIITDHPAPYTVEVNLYKYPEQSGTPFQLDSETITYN